MENKKQDIPIINAHDIIQGDEPLTYKDIKFKTFAQLTNEDKDSLLKLYTQYFKDLCGDPFGASPRTLKGYFEKSFSADYAETMMHRLTFNESYVAYVALHKKTDEVKGFITGRVFSDLKGWISHFYLTDEFTAKHRLTVEARMFALLGQLMQDMGMKEVYTEAENNPKLTNTLLQLGFEENELNENANSYKRSL